MSDEFQMRMKRRVEKELIRKMKVARHMVTAFTDLKEGEHWFSVDGWLDFYTYEPLEYGILQLRMVVDALNAMAEPSELCWEFRLFASDGSITTMANGSKSDDDTESASLYDFKLGTDSQ